MFFGACSSVIENICCYLLCVFNSRRKLFTDARGFYHFEFTMAYGPVPVNRKVEFRIPLIPKYQRCLRCGDDCPGLELHYWRKICKHCRCSREDHDLHGNESDDGQPIGMLLDSIPRPTGSVHVISEQRIPDVQNCVTSITSNNCRVSGSTGTAYVDDPKTLTDIYGSETDIVLSRVIAENIRSQKYISMMPPDKQLFAAQLRRRQLQKQLPLHDLHPKFCSSLTESELAKFHKFCNKRRQKAAGVGQVMEVKEATNFRCHRCIKNITSGGFCVTAAHLGSGTGWHPGCFTCATCNELLVDMIYFCRNEEIYCERHYADTIYPRCAACDEIILAREYTQAEKQTWHVEHFCCWNCDAPLAGQRYIAKDGNPFCMICFDTLYSKSCNTCRRTITADSPGLSHGDFHWHACPHCFSCSGCGGNLINQQFLLKDGQLFCSVDCKQKMMLSWTQNGFQNLHIH